MIVVRDVFQLKFGQAREAVALWKEGLELGRTLGFPEARLLTDRVGPFYTLVLETEYPDLAEYERVTAAVLGDDRWQKWYKNIVPLVESGRREILKAVE